MNLPIRHLVLCAGCLLYAAASDAGETGFGLATRYCLAGICLGDAADAHPAVQAGRVFGDIKPIVPPVCFSSTFGTPVYDFGNGSLGEFVLQNDPSRRETVLGKYYRIQTIRIRFVPPLTADNAARIENEVVQRYHMKKSTYRTFFVDDGKRRITFTDNGASAFALTVTGPERAEYQAQPGCAPVRPTL